MRILVLSDVDEKTFFKTFSRSKHLWEVRDFLPSKLSDASFFDALVILDTHNPEYTKLICQKILPEIGKPSVVVTDFANLDVLTYASVSDYVFLQPNQTEPSPELVIRLEKLLGMKVVNHQNVQGKINSDAQYMSTHMLSANETPNNHLHSSEKNADGAVSTKVIVENMKFNQSGFGILIDDTPINLTYREFELLKYLISKSPHVVSRDRMMEKVLETGGLSESSRVIDVHIRRIRSKLGSHYGSYIETARGIGYTWKMR